MQTQTVQPVDFYYYFNVGRPSELLFDFGASKSIWFQFDFILSAGKKNGDLLIYTVFSVCDIRQF